MNIEFNIYFFIFTIIIVICDLLIICLIIIINNRYVRKRNKVKHKNEVYTDTTKLCDNIENNYNEDNINYDKNFKVEVDITFINSKELINQ